MRPVRGGMELAGGGAATGVVGHHPARLWRTPTPYLFLGFAVMMGLIAVALLVLICTRRKPSSSGSSSSRRGSGAAAEESVRALAPLDREPKVVVIMAGDDAPSFLACAKPLAFTAVAVAAVAEPRSKADDAA